jgi:hypothetical protein
MCTVQVGRGNFKLLTEDLGLGAGKIIIGNPCFVLANLSSLAV